MTLARPSDVRLHPGGLPSRLCLPRCLVVGVLNVTPDSFSDGGRYLSADTAVRHGHALRESGADVIDVGGESTRPGADRVPPDEELRRVVPVVRALAQDGIAVSIDTSRAATARAALEAGAMVVNDVSGGTADPGMLPFMADVDVPYIVMHSRGPSDSMQSRATYDDVVVDVCRELVDGVHRAADAGVVPERIVVDPGLGFAKHPEHNWALLAQMGTLQTLGRPLLIGASRKRFLGELLGADDSEASRDAATGALTALVACSGAWGVRVHDAAGSAAAVRVVARLAAAEGMPA